MHKKILFILLSLTTFLNGHGLSSTDFWNEQIFPENSIISTKAIAYQSLACVGSLVATLSLADLADRQSRAYREGRAANRGEYLVYSSAASFLITCFFVIKTAYNFAPKQLGLGMYDRSLLLALNQSYTILVKDLTKLGLMREDAKKIASYWLLMRRTIGAKQVVQKRLMEIDLNKDRYNLIIETLFNKDNFLGFVHLLYFISEPLDKQNIKNIMYLYDMYMYEAEYIVEKYKKMQTNMLLSPFAVASTQAKIEAKFPNHPVLEIFQNVYL